VKGSVIALGKVGEAPAAALVVDGRLDDLIVDPADPSVPRPGTIFRAVADRPAKGMGGQFVRLGGGQNGFLRNGQIPAGKPALVQVTGYAEPGKAVPVTAKLLFKARFAILTPGAPGVNVSRRIRDQARAAELVDLAGRTVPEARGVILRSCAETAEDDAIAAELTELHQVATRIGKDAGADRSALLLGGPDAHEVARVEWPQADESGAEFADHGVADMIADMRLARCDLARGASAWIEPTRALVAVDVNTGGDRSPAAGLKANIALASDLPRQLRCRGLGGQIVVDFAPFPKKDRHTVEQALRAAFRRDAVDTALVGWTPMGNFELQRKRARWPVI